MVVTDETYKRGSGPLTFFSLPARDAQRMTPRLGAVPMAWDGLISGTVERIDGGAGRPARFIATLEYERCTRTFDGSEWKLVAEYAADGVTLVYNGKANGAFGGEE
jgi:hypothetical protein